VNLFIIVAPSNNDLLAIPGYNQANWAATIQTSPVSNTQWRLA
jgi:hypothetical protein